MFIALETWFRCIFCNLSLILRYITGDGIIITNNHLMGLLLQLESFTSFFSCDSSDIDLIGTSWNKFQSTQHN
ncbi:hypothetical protein Hanom_Chr03g00221071 [Helianthus anomalus]